ncbi:hypothetical protein HJC23_009743 [Cyclotella cryptica]|uniref:Uncharacterized protein n=1 Tax=Cyclotella cryptica TaxID=29204 RepID=A0ABD3PNE8_9STRA
MSCCDDVSSIESSSCRERKHTNNVISAQKAMIASLSDAVCRLACTLQSKEEEIKVRDRTESDLESKNLDLLIENAELKSQMADLKDGLSSYAGQQSTKPLTPSSDDAWSFEYERNLKPFEFVQEQLYGRNDNGTSQNVTPEAFKLPPTKLPRRKSLMNLSNLNLSRNPLSSATSRISTAKSLVTRIKGRKIAWKDKGGFYPKLIPKHVFFTAELVPISDEVSDISA